jgi:thiamine pyrophosphate-dependent acetolactate synthase large subunit-like protein
LSPSIISTADPTLLAMSQSCSAPWPLAVARLCCGKAPVGYSFKGKPWLEHDNPNAVGMTGLLGYGGCHAAINNAEVLLMLGTDFPSPTSCRTRR